MQNKIQKCKKKKEENPIFNPSFYTRNALVFEIQIKKSSLDIHKPMM